MKLDLSVGHLHGDSCRRASVILEQTGIILPNPPEPPISGVFLGIRVSMRLVLRWVKPPWRYQPYLHLENRGLKPVIDGLILG